MFFCFRLLKFYSLWQPPHSLNLTSHPPVVFPQQYLPDCCPWHPGGPDPCSAAVGKPCHWRTSRHSSELQPSGGRHHEAGAEESPRSSHQWLVVLPLHGHWYLCWDGDSWCFHLVVHVLPWWTLGHLLPACEYSFIYFFVFMAHGHGKCLFAFRSIQYEVCLVVIELCVFLFCFFVSCV